ncbi:hypothetical protein FA09DRAFT_26503 [Tilletiopsis washingtonensis]|uniref:Uncharacterized protein n=1 Tax=Tilletiopsis washingtonensis TaxID=58919 RepID=A0A316ZDI2_9BASI|nr:hypothetical protein FA09DRAFT_26503 [Tilletiopsis washingtonensis]PWN98345.1 hypothetical protein FA09DRAFT_26503 [Tilletiopsis washingtonensis]
MSANDEAAQPIDVRARIAAFGGGVLSAPAARPPPPAARQGGGKAAPPHDEIARTASLPWARAGPSSAGVSEFGVPTSAAAAKDRPSTLPYAPYAPYLGNGRSSSAASQSSSSLLSVGSRSQLRKSESGASLNELSAAAAARGQATRSRSSSTASSTSVGPARSATSSPRLGVKSIIALYGAPPDRRGSAESSLSLAPSPRATTPAAGSSSSHTRDARVDAASSRAGFSADATSSFARDPGTAVSLKADDALQPSSAPAHLLTGPFTKSASQSLAPPRPQRPSEGRSPKSLADAFSPTAAQAGQSHLPARSQHGAAVSVDSARLPSMANAPPSLPPRKPTQDDDDRRDREQKPRRAPALPSRSQSDPSEAQDAPVVSPYKVRAPAPSSRLRGMSGTRPAAASAETGGASLQSHSSPPPAPPRPAGMGVAARQRSHSRLSDSNLHATSERSAAASRATGMRSAEEPDTGLIVPPPQASGAASPMSPGRANIPPPRRVRERSSGAIASARAQSPQRSVPPTSTSSTVPPPRHFETASRVAAVRSALNPHGVGPKSCAPEPGARKRYEALYDNEVRRDASRKARARDGPRGTAPPASMMNDGIGAGAAQARLGARRVARLWRRSRLPLAFLSQVWDAAVSSAHEQYLDRESFVRAMAAIDLELSRRRRSVA